MKVKEIELEQGRLIFTLENGERVAMPTNATAILPKKAKNEKKD